VADKKLTLTFDHGPTPGVTERVLDVLRERDLHATFFPTGSHLAEPGVRALAERVLAEGHWLGNHTMTHGAPLGKRNDPAVEVGEIALAQEALGSLSHPDKLFRPNGSGQVGPHLLSPAALDFVIERGYSVVIWDIYVRDTHEPEGWADRALARLGERDWNVLVAHDLPTGAMKDLPWLLDAVLAAGIEIVQEIPDHVTPVRRGRPADWVADVSTGHH
jgi:peptidoglycan/xylan/chitin deacetylase (PgdA/CDA1 family)